MTIFIQPFHLLVIALAGWLNRDQQAVIDCLIEENRVLKDQLEGQRIRLAAKAKIVGRRLLDEIETLGNTRYAAGLAPKAHREEVDLCEEGPGSTPRNAGNR